MNKRWCCIGVCLHSETWHGEWNIPCFIIGLHSLWLFYLLYHVMNSMEQSPSEANIHTVPHASIHFVWNPRLFTAFQNSPNEVHTHFFLQEPFKFILRSKPRSFQFQSLQVSWWKFCRYFSHACCMPHNLIFIDSVILLLGEECTNYEAPHYTSMVFSSLLLLPLRSKYYPQYLALTHHIPVLIPVNLCLLAHY